MSCASGSPPEGARPPRRLQRPVSSPVSVKGNPTRVGKDPPSMGSAHILYFPTLGARHAWHGASNGNEVGQVPSLRGGSVISYQVGNHVVRISNANGRWAVTVDDAALSRWFMNQAEAWAAGVREADRLDRLQMAQR